MVFWFFGRKKKKATYKMNPGVRGIFVHSFCGTSIWHRSCSAGIGRSCHEFVSRGATTIFSADLSNRPKGVQQIFGYHARGRRFPFRHRFLPETELNLAFFLAFLLLEPSITKASTILGYETHVKYLFKTEGCPEEV